MSGSQQISKKNVYMEQAFHQAQNLEKDLKIQRQESPYASHRDSYSSYGIKKNYEQLGVRITGWGPWKTVVVPPNMYVVHTRRGHREPLHVGLGISFRFNPHLDSFLIIPSAMQTILINARSICKELQGILIQAYVQWIIDDIRVAYRRLDFSDVRDPMRVVNIQLREQAEAAIKDKVATLSIKEVLSDKQPIIAELTRRLKEVAEGASQGQKGLGIRIVTVQIKEAIVSSTELWENLQKPYRAAQKTAARLAEIENQSNIISRELNEKEKSETAKLETESKLRNLRRQKESELFEKEQLEAIRRQELEQEKERKIFEAQNQTRQFRLEQEYTFQLAQREKKFQADKRQKELEIEAEKHRAQLDFEAKKHQAQLDMSAFQVEQEKEEARMALELAKVKCQHEIELKKMELEIAKQKLKLEAELEQRSKESQVEYECQKREVELEREKNQIENDISAERIQAYALESLPTIASHLPKPDKLESIVIGENAKNNSYTLTGTVASLLSVLQNYGVQIQKNGHKVEDTPSSQDLPEDH
ncbi:MAG: hypothetical protein D6805_01065 [Planctomycetota bacterium]|nr:MAG: hypothetical protein D6805_01065 [Planctomycetota bacterium]